MCANCLFWLAYGAGKDHVTIGGVVPQLGVLAAFKYNWTWLWNLECVTRCYSLTRHFWPRQTFVHFAITWVLQLLSPPPTFILKWAGAAQSVQRLATGWTVRGSNPHEGEIFRTHADRPWGVYNGYRVIPSVKTTGGWCWQPTSI